MTEEEQMYYDLLEDSNKDLLNTIISELQKHTNIQDISMLTELDEDIIVNFLHDENIIIYQAFKTNLKTPYSIMKYINMYSEEQTLCTKVTEFLEANIHEDIYEYTLRKNMSNEILFRLKDSRNELKVRYVYNQEDEKFNFYLMGQNLHFPISFDKIDNLLVSCAGIVTESDTKSTKNLPNVSKVKDTHMTLTFNGMKITIENQ